MEMLVFLISFLRCVFFLWFSLSRYAHQYQSDFEGENAKVVSPQFAVSGSEPDTSSEPQSLPVCASES